MCRWKYSAKGIGEKMKYICLLTPINFNHKAGDGIKTRERKLSHMMPALQAKCGATQATYVLVKK